MAILIVFALFDVPRQGMSPCNFPKLDRKRDFSCLPFILAKQKRKRFVLSAFLANLLTARYAVGKLGKQTRVCMCTCVWATLSFFL